MGGLEKYFKRKVIIVWWWVGMLWSWEWAMGRMWLTTLIYAAGRFFHWNDDESNWIQSGSQWVMGRKKEIWQIYSGIWFLVCFSIRLLLGITLQAIDEDKMWKQGIREGTHDQSKRNASIYGFVQARERRRVTFSFLFMDMFLL